MKTFVKTFWEVWLDIKTCAAFLTRIPFRFAEGESERPLAQAARAFPLTGAGVGAASGLALYIAYSLGLHPMACAFVGLGVGALLTGALHEDGLADVADGFGGGETRDDKLRIMRDSRIGVYGVLAVIFSVGLRASALSGMLTPETAALALVATGALSRAVLPALMLALKPARTDGLGAATGCPEKESVISAIVIGVALAFFFPHPGAVVIAILAVAVVVALMAWLARSQIGGYTGDVLGAAQQVVEVTALLALAAAGE